MNSHKSHTGRSSFGADGAHVTVAGVVHFFWDAGTGESGHTTVNVETDDPLMPNTYDLTGELRSRVIDRLEEGRRIEIDYVVEPHEIVDHDGVVTDGRRPRILDVRIGDRA